MPVTISDDVLELGVTLRTTPRAQAEKVAESVPTEEGLAAYGVVKSSNESRYTLGVAYPAWRPDVSVAQDGHRDFVSAEVLEHSAWDWMKKSRDINLFHTQGTSGAAEVVESYIYRGPDWEITPPTGGAPYVVKSGDWLLGVVWSPEAWELVKSGRIRGYSPEGGARRNLKPSTERLAQLRN